jgi:uncharacterized repeat protein (TIGR04138 family)
MPDIFDDIIQKDSRYKAQAYTFVLTALEVAREQTKKPTHVTGQELCYGFRSLAISEFGIMAKSVLESWGIKKTDDIGEIVYNMIDAGLLSKTDEDKIEDFHNIFDFEKVFDKEYLFEKKDLPPRDRGTEKK